MDVSQVEFRLSWASEWHLRIQIDTSKESIQAAFVGEAIRVFRRDTLEGLLSVVSGYQNVLLKFAPEVFDEADIESQVRTLLRDFDLQRSHAETRLVEIPVCYDEAFAPDLMDVARFNDLDVQSVIRLHTTATYQVRFIGFAPGFGYLSGLPEAIATPRLDTPRVRVPAGSVGIAGAQTGVYPTQTAGGWRLIGRTPMVMFDPARCDPSLNENPSTLIPGDRVRFVAIDRDEYERRRQQVAQA